MILLEIKNDRYQVLAVCSESGRCPLKKFLQEQMQGCRKDALRLLALLENVDQDGPPEWGEVNEKLPKKKFHHVAGIIKQFRAGRLPLLWFPGEGRVSYLRQWLCQTDPKHS